MKQFPDNSQIKQDISSDDVATCPAPPADLLQGQWEPHQGGPWPGNKRFHRYRVMFSMVRPNFRTEKKSTKQAIPAFLSGASAMIGWQFSFWYWNKGESIKKITLYNLLGYLDWPIFRDGIFSYLGWPEMTLGWVLHEARVRSSDQGVSSEACLSLTWAVGQLNSDLG